MSFPIIGSYSIIETTQNINTLIARAFQKQLSKCFPSLWAAKWGNWNFLGQLLTYTHLVLHAPISSVFSRDGTLSSAGLHVMGFLPSFLIKPAVTTSKHLTDSFTSMTASTRLGVRQVGSNPGLPTLFPCDFSNHIKELPWWFRR